MKTAKKFLAILLSLIMVLALNVSAFAVGDETGSGADPEVASGTIKVTVSNAKGDHDFKAYQIFSGTLSTDNTLTDVTWGSGVDSTKTDSLYTELAKISIGTSENAVYPFEDVNTAAGVADVLAEYVDNSTVVEGFQKAIADILSNENNAYTSLNGTNKDGYIATVNEGYYLIVDKAKDDGNDATYASASMLQVIPGKTASIAAKQDNVPSVTKYAGAEGHDDNAQYSVGDEILYTITGTTKNFVRASEGEAQGAYSYKIVDTMGAALDLVGEFSGANNTQVTSGVTVTLVNGNNTEDITSYFQTNDKPITYVANDDGTHTLTLEATDLSAIDALTPQSEIVVTYSAKLNSKVTTGATANNHVSLTAGDYEATDDSDEVFPLTLKVTKTDGDTGATLAGAEFRLYRETNAEDGTTVKEYAEITQTGSIDSWTTQPTIAATVTTDEDGLISIIGLGAGTYYLEETKAPEGYNPIEDIEIKINAVTEENATGEIALTKLTYVINNGTETSVDPEYDEDGNPTTGTLNLTAGIVPIGVENNKGAQLPSTGGIGTKIFYAVGGVLVIGAIVLLVAKKRMDGEK